MRYCGRIIARISLLGVCLLFLPVGLQAHKKDKRIADSLRAVYRQANDNLTRLDALYRLIAHYGQYNLDSSQYFAEKAIALSQSMHDVNKESAARVSLASALIYSGKKEMARSEMNAIRGLEKRMNTAVLAYESSDLAELYERLGQRDSSLYYHLKALSLAERTDSMALKMLTSHGLCLYYYRQKQYDIALKYGLRTYAYFKGSSNIDVTGLLSDIGNIYYWTKDYDNALKYYQETLRVTREKNAYFAYGYAYNNLGLVYRAKGDNTKAVQYYHLALQHYRDLNAINGLANTSVNMAKLLYEEKQYDSALVYGQYAAEKASLISDYLIMSEAYDILYKVHKSQGAYAQALLDLESAGAYRDSVQKISARKTIAELQTQYETTQKDLENRKLKEEKASQSHLIKQQRLAGALIATLLLASLLITYLVYRYSSRQERLNKKVLAQKQQLEAANEFKDKLFSIVSHDFRSPLASLHGFLTMLRETELNEEEIKMLSEDMLTQLNLTSGFLDNLLNWAQSQMQGYKPNMRKLNVNLTVNEILQLFQVQADQKGLQLLNDVCSGREVIADASLIRMVLRNLVSNAIKFTSKGSITVSMQQGDNELVVSVKDTGKGMSADNLQKLFSGQHFTTLGTAHEKGSGLGLTLCKEFLEANGGRLWVESELGSGSTFYFSVPLIPQEEMVSA